MAKFKLNKNIAGAQSFRYNGAKYYTADVKDNQKLLKKLHNDGFAHITEIKQSVKKAVTNDEKKNDETGD